MRIREKLDLLVFLFFYLCVCLPASDVFELAHTFLPFLTMTSEAISTFKASYTRRFMFYSSF